MPENTNLVVGAGITGAVIAQHIASKTGEKVLIIDKRNHLGGNCYDYKDKNGITVHCYGSHIFHTNNESVWQYVNRFSNFNTYMHKVYANIDGIETTIPFNFNTLYDVFPHSMAAKFEDKLLKNFFYNDRIPILEFRKSSDNDLKFLASYIYKKIFLNYTKKQWNYNPDTIDSNVTARVPILISKDSRYFQDKYQGIPVDGYTKLLSNMMSLSNIELRLNTNFKSFDFKLYKRVFYTGSIDEFFDYKFGMLPYRSVEFKFEEYNFPYYQSNSVINYPNNYDFTRIHEYKYYLNEISPNTIIAKEYSQDFVPEKNDRYYPVENKINSDLYKKYEYLSKDLNQVYFLGRLGSYKYYDMDKAVANAMECFANVFDKKCEYSNY